MDAVGMMGHIIREAAELTKDKNCMGAAKIVVFCNAPEDNPFMAGAFHGVGEPDCEINVGVSGPGAVRCALKKCPNGDLTEVAEVIKKRSASIYKADGDCKFKESGDNESVKKIYEEVLKGDHELIHKLLHYVHEEK